MEVLTETDNTVELLTLNETANLTRMSKKFITKWRQAGRFPGAIRMADHNKFMYNKTVIQHRLNLGNLLLPKR